MIISLSFNLSSYLSCRRAGSSSLTSLHCELFPRGHFPSYLSCPEETQRELDRFKGCVRAAFAHLDLGVLFLESVPALSSRTHAVIDVVPVTPGLEQDARLMFTEAGPPSIRRLWTCS